MMFFRSDGPSKFYDIEKDLKMKIKTDKSHTFEYTLDWNQLKPSKKTSILEKIYQK